MQTRILTKWFEAQEGFGAIRLNTVTAILSIVAIAAAINAFCSLRMSAKVQPCPMFSPNRHAAAEDSVHQLSEHKDDQAHFDNSRNARCD
jgi:hypothetical protein